MTHDELEFAISQYLDGTLAEAEESALSARLAVDADARALLAEYEGVDRALRATAVPAVDFDELAGRISDAVALQDAPTQSYRLHWIRTAASLALAACVVVAAGVGIRMIQSQPAAAAKQIVVVDPTTRAVASTAPVTVVSIGPAAASPDRPVFARHDEDLLSRPSQVIIARSGYAAQDGAAQDGPLLP